MKIISDMGSEVRMIVGSVITLGIIVWLLLSPVNIFIVLILILGVFLMTSGMINLMIKGVFS